MTLPPPGATYLGQGRCRFRVWAPLRKKVDLCLLSPQKRTVKLNREGEGYYDRLVEDVEPGALYMYRLDNRRKRPDPASRYQPDGVHGPSQVIDSLFPWEDDCWHGIFLEDYIIYELHVGAFTAEGTFDAILPHLDTLKTLGVNALELMPIGQFPGTRNWGYDGTYPFAVQNSYGGPGGLKRLVNACHQKGLAVVLDVVYNHIGPEGNYLGDFAPYFTDRYQTPWGSAINFDGPHSDQVCRFFTDNALYWVTECHMDALRIDAAHAILDFSAQPFLEQLARAVRKQAKKLTRRAYLISENALNDTRGIRSRERGGFGLDAQWNDDFHRVIHSLLTGEKVGYYQDFGQFEQLIKAFREGFVFSGQFSTYRQRRHGRSSRDIPANRIVVFSQNHDQVGNRLKGERLSELVAFEDLKLAAGLVILSPYIPLLFMGEEYGEPARFPYFISHLDPTLVDAVRKGRRKEAAEFGWEGEPPDPQDPRLFAEAKLNHFLRSQEGRHRTLFQFYRELISLRKEIQALALPSKDHLEAARLGGQRALLVRRWSDEDEVIMVFNLGSIAESVHLPLKQGRWKKRLDSAEKEWQGPGSLAPPELICREAMSLILQPRSFVLFLTEKDS